MIVALASPRPASTLEEGLGRVDRLSGEAAQRGARVVCFPEAYLPGLRGQDFEVPPFSAADQERALAGTAETARRHGVALILGLKAVTDRGRQIASFVIDSAGRVLGHQAKTQLDPSEERFYVPGEGRRIFEIEGLRFGIAICHEGFRYPETVRWAAVRGAKIVFHPHLTGSDRAGTRLARWQDPAAPYYEKAIQVRSLENTIFFASVNYAVRFPESATSVIDPSGRCRSWLPYGQEGVLAERIDPAEATGLLASRFAPERYRERE
ncbi:MAG TPA: carbon-nitrogen hydrolase family protein [Thermoanaerobaculia bacterium]|nr:carbon-nitrogen hydrolase family protein [Thermoanaerobaculia bacterium]